MWTCPSKDVTALPWPARSCQTITNTALLHEDYSDAFTNVHDGNVNRQKCTCRQDKLWFSQRDTRVRMCAITYPCFSSVTYSMLVNTRAFNDAYNKHSLLGGVVQSRHSGWKAGRKVRSTLAVRNHAPPGSTRLLACLPTCGMYGFNFSS